MKTLQQYWDEITEKYVPLFNIPCDELLCALSEGEKVFMSEKYPGVCLSIDKNPERGESYTFFHYVGNCAMCIEIDVPALIIINDPTGSDFALFSQDEQDRWGYDFLKSIENDKSFCTVPFNFHGAFTIDATGREIYKTITGNQAITREEYLEYLKTLK